MAAKADIFARLQKEILLLEGFKPASNDHTNWAGLEQLRSAFPNSNFPTGAIHEFICEGIETVAASAGFISGILSTVLKQQGVTIWISSSKLIFPPALASFGLAPEKIIFIELKKQKDKLFVMEEALKCDSITSVIGQIDELSFTESRRFQLAVEQSKVTGFLIRQHPRNLVTSSVTRWKITPQASVTSGMPGVGFPQWAVQLLKVRNGKPGNWNMIWRAGKFLLMREESIALPLPQRKIV